jgi:hypothetical protein
MTPKQKDQTWRNGICEMCNKPFLKFNPLNKYCGSQVEKVGCSYESAKLRWRNSAKKNRERRKEKIRLILHK